MSDVKPTDPLVPEFAPSKFEPAALVMPITLSSANLRTAELIRVQLHGVLRGAGVVTDAKNRTHLALYKALANAYDFFVTHEAADHVTQKRMENALAEVISEQFVDGKYKGSKVPTQIAALVGGTDEPKVTVYKNVMVIASGSGGRFGYQTDHVPADEFASWLANHGGIENINRRNTPRDQEEKHAATEFMICGIVTAKSFEVPSWTDDMKDVEINSPVMLAAIYLGDGKFEVKAPLGTKASQKALLKQYRSANPGHFQP